MQRSVPPRPPASPTCLPTSNRRPPPRGQHTPSRSRTPSFLLRPATQQLQATFKGWPPPLCLSHPPHLSERHYLESRCYAMIQRRTTAHSELLSSNISSISTKLDLFLPIRTTDAAHGHVCVPPQTWRVAVMLTTSPVIGSSDYCLSPLTSIAVSLPDAVE